MRHRRWSNLGLGMAAFAVASVCESAGETYLVIVAGLGGEPAYRERFHEWGVQMYQAAAERYRLPEDHILWFTEEPERDPKRVRGVSTKENVTGALRGLAERVRPGDQLFVLLIGHGSSRSGDARFNLPGQDMTAEDFAQLLAGFSSQRVVFVNTASASGDFLPRLAGKNRVVVTATKTGMERNETVFGEYFVAAYARDGADTDKNERVSVFEAFEYARRQVERFYEEQNRLQTEHALLDDNGDGLGAPASGAAGGSGPSVADGASAANSFLVEAARYGVEAEGSEDPEIRRLYQEMRAIEGRIEALKLQKEAMPPERYSEELEKLLVELAEKNRAVSQMTAKPK